MDKRSPMSVELVTVTPQVARLWLRANAGNRNPAANRIAQYAADMRNGNWHVSESAICFSDTDRLLNGQNRLMAVAVSGVSIHSIVLRGVPDAAFRYMDRNMPRTTAQIAKMAGIRNAAELSAMAAILYRYQRRLALSGGYATATSEDVLQIIEDHPLMAESLKTCYRLRPIVPLSICAFVHYAASTGDAETADRFIEGTVQAFEMTSAFAPNDPRLLLARNLMQVSARYSTVNSRNGEKSIKERKGKSHTSGAGAKRAYYMARLTKAWNDFSIKDESKWPKLVRLPDDTFTEIAGCTIQMYDSETRELYNEANRFITKFKRGEF